MVVGGGTGISRGVRTETRAGIRMTKGPGGVSATSPVGGSRGG